MRFIKFIFFSSLFLLINWLHLYLLEYPVTLISWLFGWFCDWLWDLVISDCRFAWNCFGGLLCLVSFADFLSRKAIFPLCPLNFELESIWLNRETYFSVVWAFSAAHKNLELSQPSHHLMLLSPHSCFFLPL